MRDNIGTIIGLVFGSIFFVALANEKALDKDLMYLGENENDKQNKN